MTTCWTNGDTPSRFRPLRSTPMISTPTSVPAIEPTPPERLRAADDDRGDRVELVAEAGAGLRRSRRVDSTTAANAGERAAAHVDADRELRVTGMPASRGDLELPPIA